MTNQSLEDQIRRALRQRAERAPEIAQPPALTQSRRTQRAWLAAAAAVVVVATGGVTVVTATDDDSRSVAAGAGETGTAERLPRLGFDGPGFKFQRVQECERSATTTTVRGVDGRRDRVMLQSFGATDRPSPLLFLHTVTVEERANFGLLDEATGEPFTAREATGYAARDRSDRGWNLSLELSDGRALYVTALGLDLKDVIPILDGLVVRDDGGWTASTLPAGMSELPRSESWDGCSYSAWADLPNDNAGAFEINLYNDPFDERLADRVSSTIGAVRQLTIDGVPAITGDYDDAGSDHWVLFEPQPGRTMEIRASHMSQDDVATIVGHGRFVDEATWQSMLP
jgi:hypothetical protein